jgi:hypothetical protein
MKIHRQKFFKRRKNKKEGSSNKIQVLKGLYHKEVDVVFEAWRVAFLESEMAES